MCTLFLRRSLRRGFRCSETWQLRTDMASIRRGLSSLAAKSLAERLVNGERLALSKAITLVESSLHQHRKDAESLLTLATQAAAKREKPIRVGIAGSPGVGKSSFIEALGTYLADQGTKVAVLAIDPSSSVSGGSLLGDKTRMEMLSRHPLAYVRPSPTRGFLGGLARSTDEAILLCEAAGYDVIFVESVGVGQSETSTDDVVDVFLLLVAPAAGDELQGMKKGIVEIADFILINKADGDLLETARQTRLQYGHAITMQRSKYQFWQPPLLLCSTMGSSESLPDVDSSDEMVKLPCQVWSDVRSFQNLLKSKGVLQRKQTQNSIAWAETEAIERIKDALHSEPKLQAARQQVHSLLQAKRISTREAAGKLASLLLESKRYQ